ncbi:hypothetical protein MVLG_06451 [Microbotryum lychnidis-dioicae p1A1 Lamole]|uniref:glucan endo-1,3-beta-D-glucosidase n=1 Tax=Microbotryum lychnidis-dioicae (strain p1A1 Lamole / MvSl-1064) TaxID=683840 RepID=U5HHB6_USTV1|nr:hypothetical protein MVLG_06451 [Microbotryum lychnidis-dioicae p1A1 Lamole]|eukprot:KDE03019.1 hypothetical protein MVLG_06451 [Microbotryum lychnidis-dioicae p1A1 Lamole]
MPSSDRSNDVASAAYSDKTGGECEFRSLIDFNNHSPSTTLFSHPSPPRAVAMIPPSPPRPFSALYSSHMMPYSRLDASSIVKEAEMQAPTDEKRNPWSAQNQKRKAHRRSLYVVVIVSFLIAGAIAGGIAGCHFTKSGPRANRSRSDDASSNSGTPINGTNLTAPPFIPIPATAQVVRSKPSDPSQFEPDRRLTRSFYGLTYTPYQAQEPNCLVSQLNVTEDVQLLSQLTTRLRLVDVACNQSQMVLQAIRETRVLMGVYLGFGLGQDQSRIERQKQTVWAAIRAFGGNGVRGIVVGNDYVLHSANRQRATQILTNHVSDLKARLNDLPLIRTVPVGTAEDAFSISPQLVAGVDFIMANTQPVFSGIPSLQASTWITSTYNTQVLPKIEAQLPRRPHFASFVTQIGWPTDALPLVNPAMAYMPAVPGVEGLQNLLDGFLCQANQQRMKYFFASAYDEPWKTYLGGFEPYWGLFDSNKQLKNLTLPLCTMDAVEHH